MDLTARAMLRWFNVSTPATFSEDEAIALLHYSDAQEAPCLARLALLEAMWVHLFGTKGKP